MTTATLYRARCLLPITSPPIEDGALLVAGYNILSAGSYRELYRANPGVNVVGFDDAIILPPFVNTHTHLELTDFSAWAEAAGEPDPPAEFVDWVLWLVRVKRTVAEAQLKSSLLNGLQASLAAGTGFVGDILTTLSCAPVYSSSVLKGRVYNEVLGHDLTIVQSRLEEISQILAKHDPKTFDMGLSPHSSYTLSREAFQVVFDFAKHVGLQNCIHLAESDDEKRFLLDASGPVADKLYQAAQWPVDPSRASGCSPVKALCVEGLLKPGDLVVHGVEVDTDDISLLKAKGCSVALCPRSNAALNGGKAPVREYLASGVNIALGTDSLASSSSLSIWDELAFSQQWFKGEATPGQWLHIATLGGLKALGRATTKLPFEAGSLATFQVVSLSSQSGADEVEEALCHAGESINIRSFYIGGKNHLPKN